MFIKTSEGFNQHKRDLSIISDWIEGSVILLNEVISKSDVVDIFNEENIFANKDESIYRIAVKAEDESSVKKTAEVEYKINGSVKKDLLEYNPTKKIFECFVYSGFQEKPLVEKITLEDYLANKKTYSVNK